MGRNLENKKKLTPIQIMDSVGTNNVGIFDGSAAMHSILSE
jgi:hypothetical protein